MAFLANDDDALDEATGICEDPSRSAAELARWLSKHPNLAREFAEYLADAEKLAEWVSPLREVMAPADQPTLGYGGASSPGTDSASLDFGDFEILSKVAEGGMGVVYKARHKTLNKIVALKTTLSAGFQTQKDMARLQFEAEAAARLDHPNIVPIYGAGVHRGMLFFSMKYIAGGTLAEGMDQLRSDWSRVGLLMSKVARAVHYAHRCGIVHRDLKPGNILLEDGEPMIADFGLAKTTDVAGGVSVSGAIVGTAAYMPPEQARGDRGLTTAADVYALGATLYEVLTGQPPFRGATTYETLRMVIEQTPPPPHTINPAIPKDLEAVCLKALEKQVDRRYGSAGEFADELDRFVRGDSVNARPLSVISRVRGVIAGKRDIGRVNESWSSLVILGLLTATACHLAIYGLIRSNASIVWVWAALGGYFSFIAIQRVGQSFRCRGFSVWERHTVSLLLGQMFCAISLMLAMLPFDPDARASEFTRVYPAWSLIFALGLFVQGSISMGVNYLVSFLYMVLAISLRYAGDNTPLVFILAHVPLICLLVFNENRNNRRRSQQPSSE